MTDYTKLCNHLQEFNYYFISDTGTKMSAAGGGGGNILFVRGGTVSQEEELAETHKASNPDEIDIDDNDRIDEINGMRFGYQFIGGVQ